MAGAAPGGLVGPISPGSRSAALDPGLYLTIRVATELYALELPRVRAVQRFPTLTAVPGLPPSVRGVAEVAGQPVPIIDLGAKLGLGLVELGSRTCIVLVEARVGERMQLMGLVADEAHWLVELGPSELHRPPPLLDHGRAPLVLGVAQTPDALALVLDIDRLVSAKEQPVVLTRPMLPRPMLARRALPRSTPAQVLEEKRLPELPRPATGPARAKPPAARRRRPPRVLPPFMAPARPKIYPALRRTISPGCDAPRTASLRSAASGTPASRPLLGSLAALGAALLALFAALRGVELAPRAAEPRPSVPYRISASTGPRQQPLAQPLPPLPETPSAQIHTVRRGETLWSISRRHYQDPLQWPRIFEANRDLVPSSDSIYPGQQLRIPAPGRTEGPASSKRGDNRP